MILRRILKIRLKSLAAIVLIATTIVLIIRICFTSNNNNQPIIIWWTPFMAEEEKIITCDNKYTCFLTKNRHYRNHSNLAAYLFYGSDFEVTDLPLPKNKVPWAIFHEESPKNLAFFLYNEGQRLFNITSTFNRKSDFPIPLQFLRNTDVLIDSTYYISTLKKNILLKELAPVLYIQSDCDTPTERDSIVKDLMKHISVDSYGACLKNKQESFNIKETFEDLYNRDLMQLVAKYKFTIAIENAVCHDYITEKLWRPLIAGSVPIYLGSPTVEDWLPNNTSAVIIQHYSTIAELAAHIHKVNNNDQLYEKYLEHKLLKKVTNSFLKSKLENKAYGSGEDFPISAFECFVCKSAHLRSFGEGKDGVYECEEPTSRDKHNVNWWTTHWRIGKCQAKALKYFIEYFRSNFSKEIFDRQTEEYLNMNEC